MVCHFQELVKVKSIKELSVVSHKISERVDRPTDAVLSLIELDIVCFTLFSEELLVMTAFSSLNTLLLTSLWKEVSAEVSWLTTWLMGPFIE